MNSRRKFLTILTTGFVALSFVVGSAFADELLGYISKVDIDGKKLTVVDKDDKETIVTTTADTEVVTKKGSNKLDLEAFSKQVEKAKEKNKKGLNVTVTHEKGTASKIEQKQFKKKAATNNNN
jgi:uncharacterized membrane protein